MSKELIARRLLRIAFLMLMIWLVLWATSCGGKKKLIQKSKYTTEVAIVERASELEKKYVRTDVYTVEVKEKNNVSIQESFQGEIADSSKEATVTVENIEGKKVYRYTNFKNVSSGSNISESKSKDSFGQNLSKIDKSVTAKRSDASIKQRMSGSEKFVSKEKTWKIPWPWIVLVLIFYLAISYFRKTLNPLGWIK